MKRLEEIKNKIASANGYSSFEESLIDNAFKKSKVIAQTIDKVITQIAKEYASECCQATLELAKENTICFINSDDCGRIETEDYYNILEFIESKNNIVLL